MAMAHKRHTHTHTHKDYRNCCTEMREDTEISFLQIILQATSNLSQHVAVYFKLMNPLCDVLATWQCIFSSMGPHERTSPALQPQPCADTTRGSHQLSLSINCHALKTCQRHHQKDMLADTDSSPGETNLRFQAPCQTPPWLTEVHPTHFIFFFPQRPSRVCQDPYKLYI